MAAAAAIRDRAFGRTITYSRKVFVPLTTMCRDTCGYCVFVKHPSSPEARIMTPDEVMAVVRAGERLGCKEVLFSLGEKPERRYAQARERLAALGHERMTGYLRDMCARVIEETGLVPHVNAGTLDDEEIAMLKPVAGSMGMMLETVSKRLMAKGGAHYACPDKVPVQRLRTLERAGEARVPFTTGILIGIGESFAERIDSLLAIRATHERHGHIQEVIVQNFQAKKGIAMADHPEPALEDMLRTLAAARLILPAEVSLQAPPNLERRHGAYLDAGINDWGGISPLTIDHINPDHAWPAIGRLRTTTEARGFALQERLTVYPRFLQPGAGFVDGRLAPKLKHLARTDGLARDQRETAA
ncbi:MAG: 7,8-didemethyl-8-hydroxy-5-deazariboflavin synthase CofG [Sphingomonadales bacterium]|nr:7,8-didemethyl-8-hydroxy-5-deazariboflavin synthase CofG [Sphingomonadales bacterium]